MRLQIVLGLISAVISIQAAEPLLSISRDASGTALSWPIWPIDLVVESTKDLAAWQPLTNVPIFGTNDARLWLALTDEHQFFRLDGRSAVPIFQYGVFYAIDLEISPGPLTTISGRVHSNSNIFLAPGSDLSFLNPVTAAGTIYYSRAPGDPLVSSVAPVNYRAGNSSGTRALRLPIGTNELREILDPPQEDDRLSEIGKERFFNKADVVILVSNDVVHATSGWFDNFATALSELAHTNFIRTDIVFSNNREGKTIRATQVDIGELRLWSATNASLRPLLLRDVSSIYIADFRTLPMNSQCGVRIVNGQTLPPQGLTIATPNPLYVKGHFNADSAHLGTSNTSVARPAALLADAITILSSNFSNGTVGTTAVSTTVNAALVGGSVPTIPGSFSGGWQNFPRLLENWSGATLTINGSFVALFASRYATAPWGGSNGGSYYSPPIRRWSFDQNFLDPAKLPPGTPLVELATGQD